MSAIPRTLRVVPKSSLKLNKVLPQPLTNQEERAFKEPVLRIMARRQKEAGDAWPPNLRIEPHVTKRAIGQAPEEMRVQLKRLLKERWKDDGHGVYVSLVYLLSLLKAVF